MMKEVMGQRYNCKTLIEQPRNSCTPIKVLQLLFTLLIKINVILSDRLTVLCMLILSTYIILLLYSIFFHYEGTNNYNRSRHSFLYC